MKKNIIIGSILIAIVSCVTIKQPITTQHDLDFISKRGKYIYEYDKACWIATDTVIKLNLDKSKLGLFIADFENSEWTIVFGSLNETTMNFKTVSEVILSDKFEIKSVHIFEEPIIKEVKWTNFSKAIKTSLIDFGELTIPYNYVTMLDSTKNISVYLYPRQTKSDIYILGKDIHYTLSYDGNNIIRKKKLHKTILEFQIPENAEMVYQTAVVTDKPTETDVLFTLSRKIKIPSLIATKSGRIYTINVDGTIGNNKP